MSVHLEIYRCKRRAHFVLEQKWFHWLHLSFIAILHFILRWQHSGMQHFRQGQLSHIFECSSCFPLQKVINCASQIKHKVEACLYENKKYMNLLSHSEKCTQPCLPLCFLCRLALWFPNALYNKFKFYQTRIIDREIIIRDMVFSSHAARYLEDLGHRHKAQFCKIFAYANLCVQVQIWTGFSVGDNCWFLLSGLILGNGANMFPHVPCAFPLSSQEPYEVGQVARD